MSGFWRFQYDAVTQRFDITEQLVNNYFLSNRAETAQWSTGFHGATQTWKILLRKINDSSASVYLSCSNLQLDISVHFSMAIHYRQFGQLKQHEMSCTFDRECHMMSYGWPEFVSHESLLNYKELPMYLQCTIEPLDDDGQPLVIAKHKWMCHSMSWLNDAFFYAITGEEQFDCGLLSDVVLMSQEAHEFRCHKFVLARNQVFRVDMSYFGAFVGQSSGNAGEAAEDAGKVDVSTKEMVIRMPSVESVLVREFLRYLYLGEVYDLDCVAEMLIVVADMYLEEGLKDLCAAQLVATVTVDNALSMLQLADRVHHADLRLRCLQLIAEQRRQVFENADISALIHDKVLLKELLCAEQRRKHRCHQCLISGNLNCR